MNDLHELFWNYVPAQQIRNEKEIQDLDVLKERLYGAACSLLEYDCVSALTMEPWDLVDAFMRRNA